MTNTKTDRRDFLKGALVGTSVAVTSTMSPTSVAASTQTNNSNTSSENQAYLFLNTSEQDFIETVVNHMIPADDLSPKGTDIGIHYFIDRALAGSWGKGDRLYMSGPWKKGLPTQGYQLPLTPSDLYRVSIDQSNKYCVQKYGVSVKKLSSIQLEEFLLNLKDGKINFPEGPPSKVFFTMLYENIMEGMFSDPIYGGNKNKAGWKLIGFPGAIATHALDVEKYFDKKYTAPMFGISDLS
jgi:gluconate 2-dehydrogenase gamma chain